MNEPLKLETALAKAECHVAKGERLIARQRSLIEEMDRDNHLQAAALARDVLATLEASLVLMRSGARQCEKEGLTLSIFMLGDSAALASRARGGYEGFLVGYGGSAVGYGG